MFFISCNYFVNLRKEIPMTTTVLRKKVIEYVNHAEPNVLEAVYKILQVIEGEDTSTLSKEQKTELERRSTLYKTGKLKTYSWSEVKKKVVEARTRIKAGQFVEDSRLVEEIWSK